MFYETARNDHGLPHDPFKSCVVPRPIGWITTLDNAGLLNLAPFSYFKAQFAMRRHGWPLPPRDTLSGMAGRRVR